jgi:DtxR family transcriptional regulator, Mn-dependent transcriptional regulator
LDEFESAGAVTIRSVYERDRKLLEYLHELGVRPGVAVEVIARNYDETITLRIGGVSVPLGRGAAAKVWASRT